MERYRKQWESEYAAFVEEQEMLAAEAAARDELVGKERRSFWMNGAELEELRAGQA